MNLGTRNALAALIGLGIGLPAGIWTFVLTHEPPSSLIEPAPDLTKRAPECFDAEKEPPSYCPDFTIQPPKPIKNVTMTKDGGWLIEYTDGTIGH